VRRDKNCQVRSSKQASERASEAAGGDGNEWHISPVWAPQAQQSIVN